MSLDNTEPVPTTIKQVLRQYRHYLEGTSRGLDSAQAEAQLQRICAGEQIAAIELLYWKYKESNDQSIDMKFAEAFGIIRDGLRTQLEGETK